MTLLPIHILAGVIALGSGFVALTVIKGAASHRASGMIFVYAMLVMSSSGAVMAMVKTNRGNIMGGALAFYMVTTAILTTRRRTAHIVRLDLVAMLLGLAVAIAGFAFGASAVASSTGRLDGYPPPLYFIFGFTALLSVAGDMRMMRMRGLEGRRRIVRHLWRMSLAMLIATTSFFLGQAKIFPAPLRITPLLLIPALLPLVVMLYWLVRVRVRGRYPRRSEFTPSQEPQRFPGPARASVR